MRRNTMARQDRPEGRSKARCPADPKRRHRRACRGHERAQKPVSILHPTKDGCASLSRSIAAASGPGSTREAWIDDDGWQPARAEATKPLAATTKPRPRSVARCRAPPMPTPPPRLQGPGCRRLPRSSRLSWEWEGRRPPQPADRRNPDSRNAAPSKPHCPRHGGRGKRGPAGSRQCPLPQQLLLPLLLAALVIIV